MASTSVKLLILLSVYVCLAHGTVTVDDVTCGSLVKLMNSGYKVRLHSHDVKYGSGSGQQSVTAVEDQDDVNSYWAIRSPLGKQCTRGAPLTCGTRLRLQHSTSGKFLHSHHFSSPLSRQQEVSAFGDKGEGDTGDDWELVCSSDDWSRGDSVMFKHVDTSVYLGVSGHTFGRPIAGQMEVVGVASPDSSCKWQVREGVYIRSSSESERRADGRHDEL